MAVLTASVKNLPLPMVSSAIQSAVASSNHLAMTLVVYSL
jgi:hypothetical protein